MKNLFTIALFLVAILVFSCGGETNKNVESKVIKDTVKTEFASLVEYLEANGNYLNTPTEQGGAPSFISAKEVNDLLGGYIYIIDLRSGKDYADGHIDGAVNIKPENLINHVTNDIVTTDYDKIILVCYTGQTAAYGTSILRIMGINNVFDMEWGMCAWNKKFIATKWGDNAKDRNPELIETTANTKAAAGDFPQLSTGLTDPKEILAERANAVLGVGFNPVIVKFDTFLTDPSKYYIISYMTEEQYNFGHLKGSVNYIPNKSFFSKADLNTLPDRKSVV